MTAVVVAAEKVDTCMLQGCTEKAVEPGAAVGVGQREAQGVVVVEGDGSSDGFISLSYNLKILYRCIYLLFIR